MRFDAVAPYDSAFPDEVVSKGIAHTEDHIAVYTLKADFESAKEVKHELTSPVESRGYEEIDPTHCDNTLGPRYVILEGQGVEPSYSLPVGKIKPAMEERYTDAQDTVSETDFPETRLEGACYAVKDICIDKGAHSVEEVLVENVDQEISSKFDHRVPNADGDDSVSMSHDLKSSPDNEHRVSLSDKNGREQCSSGSSLICGDKLSSIAPSEVIRETELPPLQEFDTVHSSSFDGIKDQKHPTLAQLMDKGLSEEKNSITEVVPSAEEAIQSNEPKEIPNVEVGIIKLHLDSEVATTSGREESKENTNQQPGFSHQYVLKFEEADLDGATTSTQSSYIHHGHAGLNLYGPASLSGRVASSGHIAYSGSISFRSDSTTTSAHSFAFPILQSEWNCSPVKMAKADRRQLKKHRCWKTGILCCRF